MAITITEEQLGSIMPRCGNAGSWCDPLNQAMSRFDIDNPNRAAAFLAQVAHESAELQRLTENLNYSARGLVATFPKAFPTLDQATAYQRAPERIANRVYASRLGNGNEASGDGWKFRGRGLIQITGRTNYRDAGAALGLPLEQEPATLELQGPAALSAAWFWKSHQLNALADDETNDDDAADFVTITKKINGGTAGLTERQAFWARAKTVLGIG